MRKKGRVFQRLTQGLGWTDGARQSGFGFSVVGRRELTAHGCRRILTYGDSLIRLLLEGNTVLAVTGTGLLCTVFRAGCVTVEGRIASLGFEEAAYAH